MIQIGLSTGTTPFSWLIRKVTGSPVSHAFLLWDDPVAGAKMVLEASSRGYSAITYARFLTEGNQIHKIYDPKVDLTPGFKEMAAHIGDKYWYGGDVGMLEVMLGRKLGKKLRNPLHSTRSLFCSEAVAMTMLGSKYPGFTGDPRSTCPADLLAFLEGK